MTQARAFSLPYSLIRLSGQDKLSYLHGQVTQDINLVNNAHFLWTGHCSPKGKLWGVFRLFAHQDSYFLLGTDAEVAASCKELQKYGVFANVDITQDDSKVLGVISENFAATCESLGIQFEGEQTACDFAKGKALKLDENRLLLIVDNSYQLPDSVTLCDDHSEFIVQEIIAGTPSLNEETINDMVPQMVNLQALNGISFKKGCYTGQETVARMRYLGKNKRAMFILQGQSDIALSETDLEVQVGENWRRAGKVLQQAYNKNTQQHHLLAVLPNDTEDSAILRAKHNPEVTFAISPLPYSLEDN